ncbi:MAG: hypothetical protein QOG66_3101, partial [Methylobacteriaceae bacterium]|nr:hypothetical protein [Methylobacteriaceae bacterium]
MSVKRIRDRSAELRGGSRKRTTVNLPAADAVRRPMGVQAIAAVPTTPAAPARVPSTIGNVPLPDFEKLSVNLARATEEG